MEAFTRILSQTTRYAHTDEACQQENTIFVKLAFQVLYQLCNPRV